MENHPIIRATMDLGALSLIVGYFFDHLPAIATAISAFYYAILAIEKIKSWFKK